MKFVKFLQSTDKSKKFLYQTNDNYAVETGYYDLDEHIICISSQIGCAMKCVFCATTYAEDRSKLCIRNLSKKEIIMQVKNVIDSINNLGDKQLLLSYMGIGEPLLNYDNVVESIKELAKQYPNSRATICTLGVNLDLMKKLADEQFPITVKLHLSLHAPNDKLRKKLLPNAKPIKESLEALKYFAQKTNTISKVNYTLIKNKNDTIEHAKQLANCVKDYPFIVKLSKLNAFEQFKVSEDIKRDKFEYILKEHNIKTTTFSSHGTDICAGCGQLRKRFIEDFKL